MYGLKNEEMQLEIRRLQELIDDIQSSFDWKTAAQDQERWDKKKNMNSLCLDQETAPDEEP